MLKGKDDHTQWPPPAQSAQIGHETLAHAKSIKAFNTVFSAAAALGSAGQTMMLNAMLDCVYGSRFAYEHAGGHIPGAVNIAKPDDAEAFTFGSNATAQGHSTVIILYCEFSSERAPRVFRHLRNMDRRNHLASYPNLTFPHMYVLKGGYQSFHQQFPVMCNPQHAYVRMHDVAYSDDHKACRQIVKAAWHLKASCSRPDHGVDHT